jgi:choline dehydrogenase
MLGGFDINAMITSGVTPVISMAVAAGAEGWGGWTWLGLPGRNDGWGPMRSARGTDGLLPASPLRDPMPLSRAFVAAARAAGLGHQPHYNGVAYEGAWLTEGTHVRGRRHSAYHGSLRPAMARPNLTVRRNTHLTSIVVTGGRATGVRVRTRAGEETLPAGGVVLAAGAFGSPQLLMLSGIGPAEALQSSA